MQFYGKCMTIWELSAFTPTVYINVSQTIY